MNNNNKLISNNKWQIKVYSYDHGLLDNFIKSLIKIAKTAMVDVSCVALPAKNKRFALLKSAFIYSKSKIHIQSKTYCYSIYLDLKIKTIAIFNDLNVPVGIEVKFKKLQDKRKIAKNE